MRRPPAKHEEWRLDRILKRKAEAGVKICVGSPRSFAILQASDSWRKSSTRKSRRAWCDSERNMEPR
jgi:hypothetical protein